MNPLTRWRRTPMAAAISRRKRSVSEYAPMPMDAFAPDGLRKVRHAQFHRVADHDDDFRPLSIAGERLGVGSEDAGICSREVAPGKIPPGGDAAERSFQH